MNDLAPQNTDAFAVTVAAVERVAQLITSEDGDVFRVAVLGGGCSGFQYSFSFENTANDDDFIIRASAANGNEVMIAVDTMSLEFLKGSQLDFVQELIGSYFQISNPNATASCGCGTSFAI
ncbi:MAG: HesB/IscA family protein [Candidatus Puniceispirillales bacterium WSBS_2018_MAG_OTU23]